MSNGTYTVITVHKVPKKLMDVCKDSPPPAGVTPKGITWVPKKRGGFQKIEVDIREKMSQYDTRLALAHELFHCLQYLTNCEMEEVRSNEIDEVIVAALVDKKKVKSARP